jgi:hypothetical protein
MRRLGAQELLRPRGAWSGPDFGLGALAAGVALLLYERYFLKKLKDVDYL